MTTVNAPVCLLARNEFYRSICPTDKMKAVNSLSDNLMEPKQSQMTVWVTKTKQDFSGTLISGWTINVVLRNSPSSGNSSNRLSPADRAVK